MNLAVAAVDGLRMDRDTEDSIVTKLEWKRVAIPVATRLHSHKLEESPMFQRIRQHRAASFGLALTAWILLIGCNSTPDEGTSSTVTTSPPQSQTRSSDAPEESTTAKTPEPDSSMPAETGSLPGSDDSEAVAKSESPASASPTEPAPAAATPAAPDTVKQAEPAPVVAAAPAEVHVPQVILSEGQTAACKVKIGDAMPALSLPNLSGEVPEWASLQGEKATVVIFWSGVHRFAREQMQRLPREILQPFQGQGVNVVAVHVGPLADELKESVMQPDYEPAKLQIGRAHV